MVSAAGKSGTVAANIGNRFRESLLFIASCAVLVTKSTCSVVHIKNKMEKATLASGCVWVSRPCCVFTPVPCS